MLKIVAFFCCLTLCANADTKLFKSYQLQDGFYAQTAREVLVKALDFDELKVAIKEYNITKIEQLSDDIYLLFFDDDRDVQELSDSLKSLHPIIYAHPNIYSKTRLR